VKNSHYNCKPCVWFYSDNEGRVGRPPIYVDPDQLTYYIGWYTLYKWRQHFDQPFAGTVNPC